MKEKIIREKIEEEDSNGVLVLRVTLRKGENAYVRGVAAVDYLDPEHPEKRKSVDRHWREDIEKIERLKAISKSDMKNKIKTLKGEEIEDE